MQTCKFRTTDSLRVFITGVQANTSKKPYRNAWCNWTLEAADAVDQFCMTKMLSAICPRPKLCPKTLIWRGSAAGAGAPHGAVFINRAAPHKGLYYDPVKYFVNSSVNTLSPTPVNSLSSRGWQSSGQEKVCQDCYEQLIPLRQLNMHSQCHCNL